jgi:peptide/nickel transport system permease protein
MRCSGKMRCLFGVLLASHAAILFAGFIAPYDPAAQNREFPYAPPTRLHMLDASGFHRPFMYPQTSGVDGYSEDITHKVIVGFFRRGDSYKFLGFLDTRVHLFGVTEPGKIFLLGTDAYGRDVFSRLLYGGQISLIAGILATFLTLSLAVMVGAISGYYGKWVDEALMGSAELFLCLPWFYFLIGVRAFLPLHISPASAFLLVVCVIAGIGWARPARLIRSVVLSARNRTYVLAAQGFGASQSYLLRRHIVPDALGVILTQAALLIPQYVAAEAVLSFFGLGIGEPTPSWGNMLSALQQYQVLVSDYWLLAPAFALTITSVTYWLLADALHHWLQSHSI